MNPPLIEMSGGPHERGLQYGRQAIERIRLGAERYLAQIARAGLDQAGVAALVADYLPVIEAYEPAYVVEMRAIAEGAGLGFEAVALLNARTEILRLAERPDLRARLVASAAPDGCTGVIVLPQATAEGQLIHAQNWDWKADCADTAVVLRLRGTGGPDILTFTEAGGLARSGLNSAGIAITANYLESDRDYRQVGVPLALIRRRVLEQSQPAAAMQTVYVTAKSASNNMMVSCTQAGQAVAIDFECAPDETFLVHPDAGLLVHANHFTSPVALGKLRDTGVAFTPDSLYRDTRVRDLLRPRLGSISVAEVKAALFDDFATPFSVCRPPRSNAAGELSATVAMIVMQPEAGVMEVCILPAMNRGFESYSLAGTQGLML